MTSRRDITGMIVYILGINLNGRLSVTFKLVNSDHSYHAAIYVYLYTV